MQILTRISGASLAVVCAVAIAGCGGDDENEPVGDVPTIGGGSTDTSDPTEPADDGTDTGAPDDSGTTSAPPDDAPTDEAPSTEPADDGTATEPADDGSSTGAPDASSLEGQTAAAFQAITLAEQEVSGVAYELDTEDDDTLWSIDVNADGADHQVIVDWEGTEVVRSSPDGSVDSDDVGKLQVVSLGIQEAIVAAAAQATGDLRSVDLNTENGVVVWEVGFEDGGRDIDVYVNAITGEVTVDNDDNDNDDD